MALYISEKPFVSLIRNFISVKLGCYKSQQMWDLYLNFILILSYSLFLFFRRIHNKNLKNSCQDTKEKHSCQGSRAIISHQCYDTLNPRAGTCRKKEKKISEITWSPTIRSVRLSSGYGSDEIRVLSCHFPGSNGRDCSPSSWRYGNVEKAPVSKSCRALFRDREWKSSFFILYPDR